VGNLMKIQHYGILIQSAIHLIMCSLLLSFAITANAVETLKPGTSVEGHLTFTGSGALSNLMSYWTQAFSERKPLISVTIADPGGMAGIESLINGTTDLALISTPISPEQDKAFADRYGYSPHVIPVAMDAIVVYVNDLNPLTSITLEDLDAVFSSTYRCGESQPIQTWGGLGVKGNLAQQRIAVYGLTVNTGANSQFREAALCGGDFLKDFQALVGPESVESAIITDSTGIGFSSSTTRSAGIHMLTIAPHKNAPAVAPLSGDIRSGHYPMSRTLAIAVNQPQNRPLSPALQAFIDFVLSPDGQSVVAKAGYVPLH
jgi:phosphate transport system substrate-binding protein